MAKNPYETDAQVNKRFDARANAYKQQLDAQAARESADVNSRADANQRSNYVNYRMAQKALPEQMARMGLSGGATESSALRTNTNYENNYNNIQNQRSSDLTSIANSARDTYNAWKITNDADREEALVAARENRDRWRQAQQEQRENRYAKTISGWDSISGIDKEINKIQKSGKDRWRIAYLRARRAELKQAAAKSGGSGGGRGYSRGYSSGGGGGNDEKTQKEKDVEKVKKAIANARNKKGKGNKNKKFSLKNTFRGMYWGAGGRY